MMRLRWLRSSSRGNFGGGFSEMVFVAVLVGFIVLFSIGILVREKFAIGPPYSKLREDLESVRRDMQAAEREEAETIEGKPFNEVVEQFNQVARRLRVPEYQGS